MPKPTITELLNLRKGDGILLDDGRIREVKCIDKSDEDDQCVEIQEDWIQYGDIAQIIYKAPEPTLAREPLTPEQATCVAQHMQAESSAAATANVPWFFCKSDEPEKMTAAEWVNRLAPQAPQRESFIPTSPIPTPTPRKPIALIPCCGVNDEDDLIFALANDGTIFMGPARATGGQFCWIQVPSLPQS